MADQEEDDLKMALRMSMQHDPPEPKRSKPRDNVTGAPSEQSPPEANNRMLQRELMAAAAEKRMMASKNAAAVAPSASKVDKCVKEENRGGSGAELKKKDVNLGKELSPAEANKLFSMIFSGKVTKDILAQWSNQGIRFSPDPETSMGLVQHEGGPCGVLAAIQAFVLKYLIFFPEESSKAEQNTPMGSGRLSESEFVALDVLASISDDRKLRSLVKSMGEILFLCGSNKRAVIASLSIFDSYIEGSEDCSKEEIILKALEGLSIESGSDLQKNLRVNTYTSQVSAFHRLEAVIPVFQSRMGAMLFLISALLSRGLTFFLKIVRILITLE
ncbi:unnamed protein product [Ilex paraguariensis]|uniref:Deubiquitinating enzyme MINDY-3/4 conserved domain-containing protein n=1 Tax=Ilex paraguariensis TaxID=185542 RepID=A0ABC8V1X9_9AQUA